MDEWNKSAILPQPIYFVNLQEDRVVSLALMIAHGVNKAGKREILAMELLFDETEYSWRAFFRKLKS